MAKTKKAKVFKKSSRGEVGVPKNSRGSMRKGRGSKSTTSINYSPKGFGFFIPKNQVADGQKLKGSSDYFRGQKAMMKNKLLYIEQMLIEVANQLKGLKADIR